MTFADIIAWLASVALFIASVFLLFASFIPPYNMGTVRIFAGCGLLLISAFVVAKLSGI